MPPAPVMTSRPSPPRRLFACALPTMRSSNAEPLTSWIPESESSAVADGLSGRQVDDHAEAGVRREEGRVVGGVDPRAADERVRAGEAAKPVAAGAAVEDVDRAVAREDVGSRGAGHVLHRGHRVRVARARRGAGRQVDGGSGRPQGVVGRVHARAAVEGVSARAGDQPVVAGAAREGVRIRRAREHVAAGAAGEVLQGREGVRAGVDGVLRAGHREIDRDAEGGGRVVGGVGAGTAVERVVARRSGEVVVARAARERVRADGAGERVGEARADDVLRRRDRVRPGAARVLSGEAREVERDPGVRGGVVERVRAGAAVERVVPAQAGKRVVAVVPRQGVGAGLAGDGIVTGAARHVRNREERVRAGRRRRGRAGAGAAQRARARR